MNRGNISKERAVAALEPLRQRLESWRSGHKGRRIRIPEEFWEESARAAAEYGVGAVSVRLRLDYCTLKSRLEKLGGMSKAEAKQATFVELVRPVKKSSANALEFQKVGGSKLRIEFQGELTQELSKLSERLWRAAR